MLKISSPDAVVVSIALRLTKGSVNQCHHRRSNMRLKMGPSVNHVAEGVSIFAVIERRRKTIQAARALPHHSQLVRQSS